MLFNSAHFILFFPVVAVAFFLLGHRYRWILLLVASYYFYMAWEPAYAILIASSTLVDFIVGKQIWKTDSIRRKRFWLILSIVVNLGLLLFFKYYNFFAQSLQYVCRLFSLPLELPESEFLLPVGISFYTFQTLSYTIECYKGKQKAENHPGIFSLYVAFFPQLVAGPIERPQNLLHQLREKITFDYSRVTLGLQRMAWGMFKKVVIADRVAMLVDRTYGDVTHYQGPELALATLFFAVQIYCDFSGYSDIAIGAAKILGIDLMENFRSPYFSRSIAEFWRRWHISLSTWFRDYVYIPLGGYRLSLSRRCFALMVVFIVSGLWHGANWTFVVWGALHGLYMLVSLLTTTPLKKIRRKFNRWSTAQSIFRWAFTFLLVNLAWVFFRAGSVSDAFYIISHLYQGWGDIDVNHLFHGLGFGVSYLKVSFAAIAILVFFDLVDSKESVWGLLSRQPWYIRWFVYYALLSGILFYGVFEQSEFIYFQF